MSDSPRDLQLHFSTVQTTLPFSFRHRPVENSKVLVLYLHGYSDHGGSFLRRLYPEGWPSEMAEASALVPNGPFPVPVKSENGWREAYSWYFYREAEQQMMISPETAVRECTQLLSRFGYEQTPKIIVAFSQGGYLAPQLVPQLKNVKEVIAVATGYREDYYSGLGNFRLTAVHGSDDDIFPVIEARAAHAKILGLGFEGEFIEIPKLGHVASREIGEAINARVRYWSSK